MISAVLIPDYHIKKIIVLATYCYPFFSIGLTPEVLLLHIFVGSLWIRLLIMIVYT
jgi:hypothetical protein